MSGGVRQGSGAPANPRLWLQARPAQRLLVQGVMAVTAQLMRSLGQGSNAAALRQLVAERRRLLRELGRGIRGERELDCYEAMHAAVCESDAAIAAMLDSGAACEG